MSQTELAPHERIIVPLDVSEFGQAANLVQVLAPYVGGFKVGYQLGYNVGWAKAAQMVTDNGGRVFLDPKLNDIPNTVAEGAKALSGLNAWMINVHASAGVAAMRAASENKGSALLLAVTVLTSLKDPDCENIFGTTAMNAVIELAGQAAEAGVDGIICSPKELELLRINFEGLLYVTPGVRPAWASADDQARVMTPGEAVAAGADYLVIGRPITKPPAEIGSPVDAAKRIAVEIASAA